MEQLSAAHSVITLVIVVGVLLIYIIPIVTILRKAGYSGWWCLILFVPLVNIIMLWVFAFANWPALHQPRT